MHTPPSVSLVRWAGLLGFLLSPAKAGSATLAGPPNILFIMVDEMRWNVMGCAGNTLVSTPHLDRLAREGTRFATAYIAYCERNTRMVRTGRYKLIQGRGRRTGAGDADFELYDLIADPIENRNLVSDPAHAVALRELTAKLAAWDADRPPLPRIAGVQTVWPATAPGPEAKAAKKRPRPAKSQ